MTQKSKLDVALAYASWGWKVLPVVPNGKIPATEHGVHDATDNPDKIRSWFASNPRLNIGIAAGRASGIVVYDIDPRNGGIDSWDQWTTKNGQLADGITALTAGGGYHYLAAYQDGIKSCKLLDGVDLLADGRYFVAYPSEIEGRKYQWEASSDPFDGVGPVSIPPEWLASMLPTRKERTASNDSSIIKGNRNSGLTSLAGAMRSYGMSEAEILAALSVANETRCEIPLPSSEIRQIAHSVSRYEPNSDVASSVALGAEAAESLLENSTEKLSKDWLVAADDYCLQPAPIKWLVKRWIQDQALVMVHGPSGGGKTFVVLDWCLRIASSTPEWAAQKVKSGKVIYLAGEGHHGLRSRIAAWKHYHNSGPLQMWLSKAGCDLNTLEGYRKVADSIKSIEIIPSVIVIDTLHRFLLGDENSAQDAKTMLDACANLMREFDCTVILVHHTGVSDEAQHRARGSSAWKGALDIEISIVPAKDKAPMQIVQRKSKDAELAEDVHAILQKVEIPGWLDEDGQPITSAIVNLVEAPVNDGKKDNKLSKHRKLFENAWAATGAEERGGKPYMSRSGFIEYLINNMELTESSAAMYVRPAAKGKPISELLLGQIIAHCEHGWIVVDAVQADAMLLLATRKGA
jgi:hypothetical protein